MICPIMSRPMKAVGPWGQEGTEIVWAECQRENCQFWTAVRTTENLEVVGCGLGMQANMNSEGQYRV